MAKCGLASRATTAPGGELKTPAHAATHVSDIHESHGSISPWAVAAPERSAADEGQPTPQQATYSATAADFFDLVFVTVALVAYSADAATSDSAARTTTHRATSSRASSQLRSAERPRDMRTTVASTIRFHRPTADTATMSEPIRLDSLSASTPAQRSDYSPLTTHHSPLLGASSPTGPPALPHISIRGWTSRYA
jgi:hypothetical protein